MVYVYTACAVQVTILSSDALTRSSRLFLFARCTHSSHLFLCALDLGKSKIWCVSWQCYIVSSPDPPPKRKVGSGEYSTASHHGLAVAMDSGNAKPLKLFAGLQQIGGVLSRSVCRV